MEADHLNSLWQGSQWKNFPSF